MATIRQLLTYSPVELTFGTSGLRGLVKDMTDLECYINTAGFLAFVKATEGSFPTVYLAGDLRLSTPRIAAAVVRAIEDAGAQVHWGGFVPTPALALAAQNNHSPGIMVTGSHIPDDRNGIKFYTMSGEVLKADEAAIKQHVAEVRQRLYDQAANEAIFTPNGMLQQTATFQNSHPSTARQYSVRYTQFFGSDCLRDTTIVLYQHSAVGRDAMVDQFRQLGASVVPTGRSETFIPIDTENVTPEDQAYFLQLATQYPDSFAIISTDGDGDRPFVIDERGVFHRGDELGAVVAEWLGADFAALPISSSDAVTTHLQARGVPYALTRIGSPYVIVAMQQAAAEGRRAVMGWEVNGGFLLADDVTMDGRTLQRLPTRDAMLPIIVALVAARQAGVKVSELFDKLPKRFTQAGMVNNFPMEVSASIVVAHAEDTAGVRTKLSRFFTAEDGFGAVSAVNNLDGVRITFDNGDIAHIRPSGNAPQLRIYAVADSQPRADEIVRLALAEPEGILRRLEAAYTH